MSGEIRTSARMGRLETPVTMVNPSGSMHVVVTEAQRLDDLRAKGWTEFEAPKPKATKKKAAKKKASRK